MLLIWPPLYNIAHKKTRNVVERAFGVWKNRFCCVKRTLETDLNNSIRTICATAVLQNIALKYNEPDIRVFEINNGDVADYENEDGPNPTKLVVLIELLRTKII